MGDTVSRSYLLKEYDRQHKGQPGGARKIIEQAPDVTLYGYNIEELIVIADACRKENIKKEDLRNFILNAQCGFDYGVNEHRRVLEESLTQLMDDMRGNL